MTGQVDRRQRQLETRTNFGLGALAAAALAEATRVIAIDLEWIAAAELADRIFSLVWILGLAAFGLVFASVWWLGQQLDAAEREALGDELQLFLSRRSAVAAFVSTYLAAVILATIPAIAELPGRAVALLIMAVATGALMVGRLTVAKVPALGEEIYVYDDAGVLRTEHRFLVWGQTFLSLNYTMRPLAQDADS